MDNTVLLYYKLTNFYQNHRRYVKSLDSDQLLGKHVDASTLNKGDCAPLALSPTNSSQIVYPCGLIANSMFNGNAQSSHTIHPCLHPAIRHLLPID